MTRRKVACVLGGGGARGAFQVGALRALLAAGHNPSFLVGTSIGAVNAAFIGLNGLSSASLDRMESAWRRAADAELLPDNYLWLTVRSLFGRGGGRLEPRLHQFLAAYGISADLRFGQLKGPPIYLVSADLNSGRPVVYGADPDEKVLEGVMASAALPPWVHPLERAERLLVDGGVVSNLPIESALGRGATEIIALDLSDERVALGETPAFGAWFNRLLVTVFQRQVDLELALAEALEVPVRRIHLRSGRPLDIWDFSRTDELIEQGFAIAESEIATWSTPHYSGHLSLRNRLTHFGVWSGGRPFVNHDDK